MNIAIIPARSGSKGIKDKNLQTIGGHSLLARAIHRAQDAKSVDEVFVSTDSNQYVLHALAVGATPILRPEALATDGSSVIDAIFDVLLQIRHKPEYITLLQPSSPFVTSKDVDGAFEYIPHFDAVASVCVSDVYPDHLRWMNHKWELEPLYPLDQHTPRQSMRVAHKITGGIYIIRTDVLFEHKTLLPPNTRGYLLNVKRSIDIDTQEDLNNARRHA